MSCWPFFTKSPLKTMMCLRQRDEVFLFRAGLRVLDDELALAANRAADFDDAVDLRDLAASFGRRASNSSATRGRPPVMSLVLATLARRLGEQRAGANLVAFASTMTCAPAGIE